jgi:hypothetical protein
MVFQNPPDNLSMPDIYPFAPFSMCMLILEGSTLLCVKPWCCLHLYILNITQHLIPTMFIRPYVNVLAPEGTLRLTLVEDKFYTEGLQFQGAPIHHKLNLKRYHGPWVSLKSTNTHCAIAFSKEHHENIKHDRTRHSERLLWLG